MDWYQATKDFAGPVATIIASTAAAIVAVTIALRQVQIARQQVEIARGQLRYNLFTRRYDFYVKLQNAITDLATSKPEDEQKWSLAYITFRRAVEESSFLFSASVCEWVAQTHHAFRASLAALPPDDKSQEDGRISMGARTEARLELLPRLSEMPRIFSVDLEFGRLVSPESKEPVGMTH